MLPDRLERRRRIPAALRRRVVEPDFSYVIRSATVRDLPAIQRLYAHYVLNSSITLRETPKSLAGWRHALAAADRLGLPFLVAEGATGTTLGFALVEPWKQQASYRRTVENEIYISPAAHGRGLGRALLAELIERATDAGCREMIAVIADAKAEASIRLHASAGFTETSRMNRVGFKYGRSLGLVMMTKRLRKRRR